MFKRLILVMLSVIIALGSVNAAVLVSTTYSDDCCKETELYKMDTGFDKEFPEIVVVKKELKEKPVKKIVVPTNIYATKEYECDCDDKVVVSVSPSYTKTIDTIYVNSGFGVKTLC